jgi:hypothetical protein
MKKLSFAILALLSLVCVGAEAKQNTAKLQACPFTDTFDISGGIIGGVSASGNLSVKYINSTEFTAGCANNQSSDNGDIHLAVYSQGGSCNLDIQDGPYMWDPNIVNTQCQGSMKFSGMDHQLGTFQYTLRFTG